MQPCPVANRGCANGRKNRRRAQAIAEPRETDYFFQKCAEGAALRFLMVKRAIHSLSRELIVYSDKRLQLREKNMDIDFQSTLSIADTVAIVLGCIGTLLGIMNIWKSMNDDRVKLLVLPKTAIPIGHSASDVDFCIEVLNKSHFPVTIVEVGFFLKGTTSRASIIEPIVIDGGSFPRRLEARSSVTVYLKARKSGLDNSVKCAFAKTDCGEIRKGNSAALKHFQSF